MKVLTYPTKEAEVRIDRIVNRSLSYSVDVEHSVVEIIKAVQAGVKLAMGTDAGSPAVPHDEVVREIEVLCETGICASPMEAIVVSTRNGADMLGVLDKLGTLAEGKLADVLVVGGDPLVDLGVLRNVDLVFLGGKLVVKDRAVLSAA